jgi:serine/threonine protein kinase
MASVNQNWTSFQNIDLDSDHAKKIQTVLQNANFSYLCSKAVELRKKEGAHVRNTLICSVDTAKFTSGAFNVVVALTFSDSIQWVARIMLPQGENDEDILISLRSEISTMELIRTKTTIPVPRIFGYGVTTNELGYPYLLMEALSGNVLENQMAFSVPDEHKGKFSAQLARYIYELSTIRFSQIGRILYLHESELPELLPFSLIGSPVGPLSTSLEYFYLFRRAQTNAILQEHRGQQEWEAAAWLLEKSLTTITTEEHIYGPFPLCHLDLHFNNILVDGDYNITGIIDWSNAQTVPIERFAINPEFIPPPAASVEFKEAILEFRDMFVDALEKVEREKEGSRSGKEITLHRLFASPLSEVVYRCTCSYPWRAVFDAQLVLPLIYGRNARWDDFQKFHNERSA